VTSGAVGLSALALAFGVCCVAPQPAYLMHQLPGLDNQKFPPWDGKLFATKVSDTLAAGVQKN